MSEGASTQPESAAERAERVGVWAGTLALAEVGLGSLLHAFHIPLTGTMLSLNQGLFLSRVTRLNRDVPGAGRLGFEISSVTALLKSFAPVGKRLTPMLAIATQGLLFTSGVRVFGVNLLGAVMGSMLLACWGIAQPAILTGIMISVLTDSDRQKIFDAWSKLVHDVDILSHLSLVHAVLAFLGVKCFIAASLAIFAWRAPTDKSHTLWSRWETLLNRGMTRQRLDLSGYHSPAPSLTTQMKLAFRDLRQPVIWLSVGIIALLSYFIDSELAPAVWIGLRALAGVYVVYLALRLLPWDKLLNPENNSTRALRSAIMVLQGRTGNYTHPGPEESKPRSEAQQ